MKLHLLRKFLAVILLSALSILANAQPLQYQWANAITGNGSASVHKLITDDQENIYVAGTFSDTVDLDPGNGVASFMSANGANFVAKYNAQGNYLFAFQLTAFVGDLSLDNDGNLWIAGQFISTFDADGGPGVTSFTAQGLSDIYVAKYTSAGSFTSAFSVGGPDIDRLDAILFDSHNNLYIGGDFKDTIDFNPGNGTGILISNDEDDTYIAKYGPNGSFKHAFRLGTDAFYDIVTDSNDNIILSAGYSGSCDVDPGAGTVFFNSGGANDLDGFWAKYDSTGAYIKGFTYEGIAKRIAIDGDDNFYIGGLIPNNTMDVDLGTAVQTLYTQENYDIYLVKYSPNDSLVYAKSFECPGTYDIEGIAVDGQGNAYIYGDMPDTANFNPGFPGGELIAVGMYDGFVASFDAGGDFIMAQNIGDASNDIMWNVTANSVGSVWLVGRFAGSSDFNFESPVNTLSSGANAGGFFAKYHNPLFTSIPESTIELPIKIYGAESKVFVDFSALATTNAHVQVLNILGQTVYQTSHNQSNKLTINLPETGGQIYFVRVVNGDKSIAKKLWID